MKNLPWYQILLKWLIIAVIVVIVLFSILLGLGYLLNENEQATRAYLEQRQQVKIEIPETPIMPQEKQIDDQLSAIKNIIIEHNTCRNDQQCTVVNTGVIELGCFVPVNSIGASLLRNTIKSDISDQCISAQPPITASCQANNCMLINSNR